ncbi:hypothetical protein HMPREF9148_01948 [Prevotella sp. F0091]|nr:hypothetical protein HMPREF9148_01948 [Prevotella sp. F0091]
MVHRESVRGFCKEVINVLQAINLGVLPYIIMAIKKSFYYLLQMC